MKPEKMTKCPYWVGLMQGACEFRVVNNNRPSNNNCGFLTYIFSLLEIKTPGFFCLSYFYTYFWDQIYKLASFQEILSAFCNRYVEDWAIIFSLFFVIVLFHFCPETNLCKDGLIMLQLSKRSFWFQKYYNTNSNVINLKRALIQTAHFTAGTQVQ